MKKIIFKNLILSILSTSNTLAEMINCNQFEKISAKYLECKAKNIKDKSKQVKKKIVKKKEQQKEKFNRSNLKKKLIKFKNSKTLTNYVEKQ